MSSIYTITADELKKSWFNLGWDYFAAYQGLPIESEDYPDFMCGYNAAKSKVTPKSQDRFHKKWLQMRYGALKRNRYFNDMVTPEYIKKIDVEYCPVTFLKLTHSTGQDTDWSVDRVSNDIGYVLGNLVIVSSKANTAKWSMSYEEITDIALKKETVNGLTPIEWKRWRSISGLSAPKVNDEGESEFGFYHTPQLIVPPKGLYINPHAAMQNVLCSFAITGNRSLYDVLTAGLNKANRQNINDLVRLIKKHAYAVCYHPLDVWAVDKLYDKYEEYYQQILRTDSTVFYNNYDHLFSKSKKPALIAQAFANKDGMLGLKDMSMLQPNLRAEGKGFAAPVLANIKHSQFTCICGIKFDGAIEAIVAKETHLNHMRIELNRQAIYGARAMYKRLTNIKPPPTRLHITGNCMLTIGHADVQQDEVNLWAYDLLSLMHLHYTIEHIYTGGQTGVDTAVAAAAMLLNIPLTVTYPEGFLQRQQNGQLINFTQEQVAANLQIQMDSLKLRLKLIENLK